MNLNLTRPKNEIEDLLLSITKNGEKLVEQTHRKPEETLEFKMTKPRDTFHFNPPIQIKEDWILRLTDLELYNSIFNITKENNKFDFSTDTLDKFPFTELEDEVQEILGISNITHDLLEDEIIGQRKNKAYREIRSDESSHDGYIILLMGYARSPFRDFGSYLRIVIGLDEDDIHFISKQYNEKFVTYELDPGNYTIEYLQKAVHPLGDHEGTLQIEYDDLNKRIKLVLKRFGSTFGTLRFDKKSFFHIFSGFEPYWDYKPTNAFNADAPGVYTSDKIILYSSIKNKVPLKCGVIDGSIQDGLRQPIFFSFVLDKPSGYKVFCQPETIHFKKINKSVLNTIKFYLEDENNDEVNFNQEMVTFTLQMIKVLDKRVFCVIIELSKI